MKPALLALCLLSPTALACDTTSLELSGSLALETCPRASADCTNASQALYEYMEAVPDSETTYTVGLHASPWHLYDGQMRILTIDDAAAAIRGGLTDAIERVELLGSWTGVAPGPGESSLADRLSTALDGFPVTGEDGFLWLSADGSRRTTRQAFTVREGAGPYFVPRDGELITSLVAGWPAYLELDPDEGDPELLMRAAAGWDIWFLCPDKALAGFERAARKGSAIAAYNAAIMRLERGDDGDADAGLALLERGASLGDARSRDRLEAERSRPQE